jgi:2-amino-4-hydroxy-6-hydroxymethyldihydropteridine diphosphokinase
VPSPPRTSRIAIALGSNLGDRRAHLEWAIVQLNELIGPLLVSSVIETEPFDVPGPQPPYLNAVAIGETAMGPSEVIELLLRLERQRGRERFSPRAPRTLDLDLILYGNLVLDSPELVVPHPRFRERRFVLEPLAEIAPDWRDPVTGKAIDELLRHLPQS